MRLNAQQQAESTFSDARARSTEAARDAARQVWERSEPLRQGAKDVGEGLSRAWTELRASFGKAAGRLQTEIGTSSCHAQDRRERLSRAVMRSEDRHEAKTWRRTKPG